MSATQYLWRPGSRVTGIKAQVAGEEVERIRAENGGYVKPADLVEAARPDDAPLHPGFTWDDALAAKKQRESEARSIIGSLVVVHREATVEEPQKVIRAFVSVTKQEQPERAYTSIRAASANEDQRRELVQRAFDQLRAAQKAYRDLSEFAAVWAALHAAEQEHLAAGGPVSR